MQTERFRVGTVLDPDLKPFLENGSSFGSSFDSKFVSLVLNLSHFEDQFPILVLIFFQNFHFFLK